MECRTIHGKIGRVLCGPAFVLGEASVVAAMSCFDSVDGQNANLLARLRHYDTVICGQIVAHALVGLGEAPPSDNWKVALNYRAHGRN